MADKMIIHASLSGDEEINFDEFCKFFARYNDMMYYVEPELREVYDNMDLNKDGILDIDEIVAAILNTLKGIKNEPPKKKELTKDIAITII